MSASSKSKNISVNVVGKVKSFEKDEWSSIEIVDLNAKGLCMTSTKDFSEGELLEFDVPTALAEKSQKNHHFFGRVIWHKDSQYGVQFLKKSVQSIKS